MSPCFISGSIAVINACLSILGRVLPFGDRREYGGIIFCFFYGDDLQSSSGVSAFEEDDSSVLLGEVEEDDFEDGCAPKNWLSVAGTCLFMCFFTNFSFAAVVEDDFTWHSFSCSQESVINFLALNTTYCFSSLGRKAPITSFHIHDRSSLSQLSIRFLMEMSSGSLSPCIIQISADFGFSHSKQYNLVNVAWVLSGVLKDTSRLNFNSPNCCFVTFSKPAHVNTYFGSEVELRLLVLCDFLKAPMIPFGTSVLMRRGSRSSLEDVQVMVATTYSMWIL